MFERLQKPFLTVETGEAYQPVQVCFLITDPDPKKVIQILSTIRCLQQKPANGNLEWEWRWQDECDHLPFNSLSIDHPSQHTSPLLIGTLHLEKNHLFLRVHSFKRACIGVSFFIQYLNNRSIHLDHADFTNKIFSVNESTAHGFSELFNDQELERLTDLRMKDYQRVNALCEEAEDADAALRILQNFTNEQAKKPFPVTERYSFPTKETDPEVVSLSFYIFLRGRELVAIRRWFGESTYNLEKAMNEVIEQVFGELPLDSF